MNPPIKPITTRIGYAGVRAKESPLAAAKRLITTNILRRPHGVSHHACSQRPCSSTEATDSEEQADLRKGESPDIQVMANTTDAALWANVRKARATMMVRPSRFTTLSDCRMLTHMSLGFNT